MKNKPIYIAAIVFVGYVITTFSLTYFLSPVPTTETLYAQSNTPNPVPSSTITSSTIKPKPIPPKCCRPFRAELHSSYFETASDYTSREKYGNVMPERNDTGVETEEVEIYKLNLEEYRLYTQMYERRKLISKEEARLRLQLYTERKESVNRLFP